MIWPPAGSRYSSGTGFAAPTRTTAYHHLPLYRQTENCAARAVPGTNSPEDCLCLAKGRAYGPARRARLHIPRSSMAQWLGICGVRLAPLAATLKDFILGHDVLHADETPVAIRARPSCWPLD